MLLLQLLSNALDRADMGITPFAQVTLNNSAIGPPTATLLNH
jgi:hypothetical protein